MDQELLKYPIGQWKSQLIYKQEDIQKWIEDIQKLPYLLKEMVQKMDESVYNNKYRPDSWTIHQIIHHIADSHVNGYIRHKLTVTQHQPTINPYLEASWAELEDVKRLPLQISLDLIVALHQRWAVFLDSVSNSDLEKCYYHPEHQRFITLQESIGMYSWHGRHHLAHIRNAVTNPY
ncbi:MAG: putative metal-dependent hydrolase [Saprospiraceae bacterium]